MTFKREKIHAGVWALCHALAAILLASASVGYALASAIIEARKKSKLSQKELARRMGTTQPMIARMEGGRQPPSTKTLLNFAKATGTRLEIRFTER